jgi:hypothetical protein
MGYTPPFFEVRKVGTTATVYPSSTTGDVLVIRANGVDVYPKITIEGNANLKLHGVAGGGSIIIYDGADGVGSFALVGGADMQIATVALSNYNIFLNPNGTGKVKFGTHTGSGDVACNGSIAILDSAGNARKLMTTA